MLAERQKLLLRWLPSAEPPDLPGLTHLLHGKNPTAVAEGLAGFFARYPIPESLRLSAWRKQQNQLLCAASAVTSQNSLSVQIGGLVCSRPTGFTTISDQLAGTELRRLR